VEPTTKAQIKVVWWGGIAIVMLLSAEFVAFE
jgi:hypothetical protein